MIKNKKILSNLFILGLLVAVVTGCETPSSQISLDKSTLPQAVGGIPARPRTAMTGSQFIRYTARMSAQARENAIWQELRVGNLPNFLRQPKPVNFSASIVGRGMQRATVWVLPDYLAIGSDYDFVRIPMTPLTAQKVADRFGYVLPTRKMVNEIYRQAAIKLSPRPMPPGRLMVSNDYYRNHNRTIEGQLKGKKRGALTAGHKKDIVLTNLLARRPRRVAIYGWHKSNSQAIQPLSTVHGEDYADYSHGVRLVRRLMSLNNKTVLVTSVLKDPVLSRLLSDEGAIAKPQLISTLQDKLILQTDSVAHLTVTE